jgi:outer membrane PBP1 activator LpoA protein
MRNHDDMSVSKLQIDSELHAAERALEAATERRRVAEHALWQAVGASAKKATGKELVDAARAEQAEAEKARVEAEALVAELRRRLVHAQERETSLLAVTDMLMARDDARRANGAHSPHNGNGGSSPKPGRRSLLDRLRGR